MGRKGESKTSRHGGRGLRWLGFIGLPLLWQTGTDVGSSWRSFEESASTAAISNSVTSNSVADRDRRRGLPSWYAGDGQPRPTSRSAPTSAVCPPQTHRLHFAAILGRGGRCRPLPRRKLRNSQRSTSPKAALGVARMCLAASADRLVLARLGLLASHRAHATATADRFPQSPLRRLRSNDEDPRHHQPSRGADVVGAPSILSRFRMSSFQTLMLQYFAHPLVMLKHSPRLCGPRSARRTPIQRRSLHRQASPMAGSHRVAPATTRKAAQDSRFDTFRLLTHPANSPSRKSKTHIGHPGFLNKALEHRLNLPAIHPLSLRPHLPTPHTLHPLAAMSKAHWLCPNHRNAGCVMSTRLIAINDNVDTTQNWRLHSLFASIRNEQYNQDTPNHSNNKQPGVAWQFNVKDARKKLKSLYPKIKT